MQPHIDFGMKLLGGDIMSIPGLYRLVQVLILFQSGNWNSHFNFPICDFALKGKKIFIIICFLQDTIKKQVASLYLWPQTLEIPILDAST